MSRQHTLVGNIIAQVCSKGASRKAFPPRARARALSLSLSHRRAQLNGIAAAHVQGCRHLNFGHVGVRQVLPGTRACNNCMVREHIL